MNEWVIVVTDDDRTAVYGWWKSRPRCEAAAGVLLSRFHQAGLYGIAVEAREIRASGDTDKIDAAYRDGWIAPADPVMGRS